MSATWGQYLREARNDQTDPRTGRALRVSKRYSRGGQQELKLVAGDIKMIVPDPEFPDVYIRGQVPQAKSSHDCDTVFGKWAGRIEAQGFVSSFQPVLQVEGIDGASVFQKRLFQSNQDDLEERLTAMLYRHQVEFAIGHGVSVHAEVAGKSQKATNDRNEAREEVKEAVADLAATAAVKNLEAPHPRPLSPKTMREGGKAQGAERTGRAW